MRVCRKANFNAAHRLFRADWSDEKNQTIFGKCNNPNFHGHNYTLEVWIDGSIDPETGYVIDLKIVKDLIKSEIEERFDHRNLNLDCPEFANLIPTAENISVVCFNLLRTKLDSKYSLTIRLWETENNIVELVIRLILQKTNSLHLNLLHLGHSMLMTTGKHPLHIQQLQLMEIM